MQQEEIKPYIELLNRQKISLFFKRVFDIVVAALILLVLSPFFLLLAVAIKIDSKGPVFFRQVRVGLNGQDFRIYKFRSMVQDADKKGLALTTEGDSRITRVGKLIRKCRLDEFSQVLNVLDGTMSLVGPRPEVRKYVDAYKPEYLATLLVRPGVTATASIHFKDEDELLNSGGDPEEIYINDILPEKMRYNLEYLNRISVWQDFKIMLQTVVAVFKH
ncbi:MAG: sugar transferase [Clostridium sp.]|uniref:sugar transferase n=1 Tax=Clostridium sp. TaxID=1506 RepID=UPI00290F75FE|nr:sugar transferase [Clostridium sp.]MDU7337790.1 sugar transferase [Clostridium sp.]